MQALLDTWIGKAGALIGLLCVAFAWVWFIVHGQIDPGIFQSIFTGLLGALGVHLIHTSTTNAGTASTVATPTPAASVQGLLQGG